MAKGINYHFNVEIVMVQLIHVKKHSILTVQLSMDVVLVLRDNRGNFVIQVRVPIQFSFNLIEPISKTLVPWLMRNRRRCLLSGFKDDVFIIYVFCQAMIMAMVPALDSAVTLVGVGLTVDTILPN